MLADRMTVKNPELICDHSEDIVRLYLDSIFVAPQHINNLSEHTYL